MYGDETGASGSAHGNGPGGVAGGGRAYWRAAALAALALLLSAALSVAAPTGTDATAAPAHPAAGQGPRLGDCGRGELCLWPRVRFRGERHTYRPGAKEPGDDRPGTRHARSARSRHSADGARTARFGRCERLPGGAGARSFANLTGRPVTVYESAECAETRDFHTHPSGAWTPQGAYTARAFKVWER
jgi:hypothetical protein